MTTLKKCIVKGPKGLWVDGVRLVDGDTIELTVESAMTKLAHGNIYAPGEYEELQESAATEVKLSQAEKGARNLPDGEEVEDVPPVPAPPVIVKKVAPAVKASPKPSVKAGGGSKGS